MLAEIIGPDLLIVLLVAVVVLFGGAAIPKFARNLGSAKKEFEKGLHESHEEGAASPDGAGGAADQTLGGKPQNPNSDSGSSATH